MPSKSHMQLPYCASPHMSDILDTKGDTDIRPEIGYSCVICSSELFGSNIQSQKAQSTLMSILQGQ